MYNNPVIIWLQNDTIVKTIIYTQTGQERDFQGMVYTLMF